MTMTILCSRIDPGKKFGLVQAIYVEDTQNSVLSLHGKSRDPQLRNICRRELMNVKLIGLFNVRRKSDAKSGESTCCLTH